MVSSSGAPWPGPLPLLTPPPLPVGDCPVALSCWLPFPLPSFDWPSCPFCPFFPRPFCPAPSCPDPCCPELPCWPWPCPSLPCPWPSLPEDWLPLFCSPWLACPFFGSPAFCPPCLEPPGRSFGPFFLRGGLFLSRRFSRGGSTLLLGRVLLGRGLARRVFLCPLFCRVGGWSDLGFPSARAGSSFLERIELGCSSVGCGFSGVDSSFRVFLGPRLVGWPFSRFAFSALASSLVSDFVLPSSSPCLGPAFVPLGLDWSSRRVFCVPSVFWSAPPFEGAFSGRLGWSADSFCPSPLPPGSFVLRL